MNLFFENLVGKRVRVYTGPPGFFIWREITKETRPKNLPEVYSEDFRPLNLDESRCLATCFQRGRLRDICVLALTDGEKYARVFYSCDKFGLTLCILKLLEGSYCYIMTGMARLNPVDSFNKTKGQKLAFYRAVTGK